MAMAAPGAPFELTATLAVSDRSIRAGYVSVIFLAEGEIGRDELWFAPQPIELPPVSTRDDGTYRISTDALDPDRYQIRVTYAGDIDQWPTDTDATLEWR